MAALESSGQSQQPSQRPSQTGNQASINRDNQAGLSKKDAAISERLQRLKDATRPGLTHVTV